jgi:mono/diheme cytochrome c family protein
MRIFKRIILGLGVVIVLAIVGMVVKFYALSPKVGPVRDLRAPTDEASVKRGEYLARHVYGCTGCHSKAHTDLPGDPEMEDQLGSGRDFGDFPDIFPGRIRSRNLTSDKSAGIGGWTDGEVVRAMREGVDRNGKALFPIMPYPTYAKAMSDDDALAVLAYLRTLPPNTYDPGRMEIDFPLSMIGRAIPKPLVTPAPPAPLASDAKARGEWLLVACSCGDCHSTVNKRHEPLPGMYLAGGNEFPIANKGKVYISNITSDAETGIGSWTDGEVFEAIRHGVSKRQSGRALYGMPWPAYGGMTDDDLHALVSALRRVPAVRNAVKADELRL